MSVILIRWRMPDPTGGTYPHIGLLLSKTTIDEFPGLHSKKTKKNDLVYISLYLPKSGTRFNSQLLSQDKNSGSPLEYLVLPSIEDGNKSGLSESVIAKVWEEIYKMKKIPHEVFCKQQYKIGKEKEEKEEAASNALIALSNQFKLFDHQNLNCVQFLGYLLEKAGACNFIENSAKQFDKNYFYQLKDKIYASFKDHQLPMTLHPVKIIASSNVAGELAEANSFQRSFLRGGF